MVRKTDYEGYVRYYEQQQRGGNLVFRGGRRSLAQRGDGFGDVVRGLFRWFAPVLASGASTFASKVIENRESGQSLGDAAKGALTPALGSVLAAAAKRAQGGSGNFHSGIAYKRLKKKLGIDNEWHGSDDDEDDIISTKNCNAGKKNKKKPEKHKKSKEKRPLLKYNF